jgi:hypothetical protein
MPESLPSLGMMSSEIENLMRQALDTLKLVGGSSIMSRKAHRCLQRYLDSFTRGMCITSLVSWNKKSRLRGVLAERDLQNHISNETVAVDTDGSWPYGLASGDMSTATPGMWDHGMDDLMTGLRPEDFLGDDMFAMSYNISDFDATGFI